MLNEKGYEMKVGTVIKAFDFPGTESCYFIGKVIEIKGGMITATIVRQVFEDEDVTHEYEPGDTFRTPVQGSSFMDSKYQRIVVLG